MIYYLLIYLFIYLLIFMWKLIALSGIIIIPEIRESEFIKLNALNRTFIISMKILNMNLIMKLYK